MDVMATARSIGLVADERGEMFGTMDEAIVVAALAELAAARPEHADLIADSSMRVALARSAGSEVLDAKSVNNPLPTAVTVQLRYRSEMADVFVDLAIEIGLREARRLSDAVA